MGMNRLARISCRGLNGLNGLNGLTLGRTKSRGTTASRKREREFWFFHMGRHAEILTNIKTLDGRARDSCKQKVNLELRYGTWVLPAPNAAMTFPNADKLLLIHWASFKRNPVAAVFPNRSEPARSIKCNFDLTFLRLGVEDEDEWDVDVDVGKRLVVTIVTVKTQCDRLDCALAACPPIVLFRCPDN